MDTQHVELAFDAIFLIAAIGPSALVVIYRLREVPLRRTEIAEVMKAAFGAATDTERKAKKQAVLRDNPYISDPEMTFDRCHSGWRYVFPLGILAILNCSIAYIVRAWTYDRLGLSPHNPTATLSNVLVMALAGGFVWSLFQLVSRTSAGELGPSDLYEIDLGVIAAVPIGYAFSLLTIELDGVRTFMAFAASAFPVRDVSRIVRQYVTRKMLNSTATPVSRPAERHLGTAIEGLSDQTLARLGELHISTVLDMAYSDPVKVMVQTGFALPVIIDWVDQSIWALYVGDLKGDFAAYGLRCSIDVCEFVEMHLRKDGKNRDPLDGADRDALLAVAAKLKVDPTLAKDLFLRIYVDPQVRVLRELWYPGGVPAILTER